MVQEKETQCALCGMNFLGDIAKLRKATIDYVMSVRPHGTTRLQWTYFHEIFEDLSRNFKFHYNRTRINSTLHEDQYTFLIISRWVLLRMKNTSDKICREIETQILCSITYLFIYLFIRLRQCLSLHTDTTPPQPNHNVTPTHIEPEQYNTWNNSTNKSQAPEDGCINIRNMLSIK